MFQLCSNQISNSTILNEYFHIILRESLAFVCYIINGPYNGNWKIVSFKNHVVVCIFAIALLRI